jgi:hypothetical protein
MEQAQRVKVPAQVEVWVGVNKVEAGWEDRLQQVQVVIVFAQNAEQQLLILLHSLAIK